MGAEVKTHSSVWKNRDESSNFPQRHDPEIIKEDKLIEVEAEIRVQVDVIMREELQNLKDALDKDKGKKAKKGKGKKGKKGGKGKKGKKGKKKKAKKVKGKKGKKGGKGKKGKKGKK